MRSTGRPTEGIIHILASFAKHGTPAKEVRDWTGRWWTLWGAVDLVPMGAKVMVAIPSLPKPLTDASEISISSEDHGRVTLANGFARHGEEVRRIRGSNGGVAELWIGDARYLSEAAFVVELEEHYPS